MFNADGRLHIFEDFLVDHTLPKFNRKTDAVAHSGDFIGRMAVQLMSAQSSNFISFSSTGSNSAHVVVTGNVASSWWRRFCFWFRSSSPSKPEPKPEMTVQDFFRSVKNNITELRMVDERVRGYEAALTRARAAGQTAMVEQLEKGVVAVRAETQLVAVGAGSYLDEAVIVDFVKKSPKGLRLDWIKHFTRVIPDQVLSRKRDMDERGVFDNYAILHYDPQAKSWAETEADKAKRKDPILFGLIEGRRRLYFVGDWVDEYCDLTLDQIADVLGRDELQHIPPQFEGPYR